jgi:outer membrane immunogenic protein
MRSLRVLLCALSGLCFGWTAVASAADLTFKAPPPAPTWAGPYIGGTLGVAWGSFDPQTSTTLQPGGEFNPVGIAAFNALGIQSAKGTGFDGGFEAGYNWQQSAVVFGVEADIESFRLSGTANTGPVAYTGGGGDTVTLISQASTTWLATVRGRLGIANPSWLIYVTGGAAFTNLHGNFSFSDATFGITETASASGNVTGYTVGGGVETKLSQRWSVKAEYLYVKFPSLSASGILGAGLLVIPQPFTHSVDLSANIVRVGLNYHF